MRGGGRSSRLQRKKRSAVSPSAISRKASPPKFNTEAQGPSGEKGNVYRERKGATHVPGCGSEVTGSGGRAGTMTSSS